MKLTDMTVAVEVLVEAIKTDYRDWMNRSFGGLAAKREDGLEYSETNRDMIERFEKNLRVEEGKKYIKIIQGGSVWGFVVKDNGPQFKEGDILKAASWASPAKNAARGNVFNGYSIAWTGPHYLR
jgi:hypothetical protein